jgi:hypothetical protein
VLASSSKLIVPMMHSIVFLISNIYQSIITSPSISIDLCFCWYYFSSNNRNESLCFYIRNYLCIYLTVSFEKSKYYCFHSGSSSSLSSHSCWSEVALICFNGSRPYFCFFLFLILKYTLTNIQIPIIYCFWI